MVAKKPTSKDKAMKKDDKKDEKKKGFVPFKKGGKK